jgi:NADPH:quinone reductase-like Zn-dependent oxidoreductase
MRVCEAWLLMSWLSMTSYSTVGIVSSSPDKRHQASVKELLEAGKVVPVIHRRYPLSEVPDALRYLEEEHTKGKIVIAVPQPIMNAEVQA